MLCHLIPTNEKYTFFTHLMNKKSEVDVSLLVTCNYMKCVSLWFHLFLSVPDLRPSSATTFSQKLLIRGKLLLL